MERTLAIIKPDGIKRKLVGEILKRYEQKNLNIIEIKMIMATKEILEKHYGEHKGKPFYNELISYMNDYVIVMRMLFLWLEKSMELQILGILNQGP